MPTYHCFFLARDGHVADVGFEECREDAEAIRWAERRARGQAACRHIELWLDDRLVSARPVNGRAYERLAEGRTALDSPTTVAASGIGDEAGNTGRAASRSAAGR